MIRRNYNGSRVYSDCKVLKSCPFSSPFLVGEEGIFISLISDVVDVKKVS